MKKFLLALAALLLLAGPARAATTPNNIITAQTPKLALVQFLQGTDVAGTYKTLYTGGANGSKISALYANTNDGSASHLVTCELVRSAVLYGGVAVTVAVNSGYANAAPAINLMSTTNWPGLPFDGNGNPYIFLSGAGDTVQCTFATALTAAKLLNVTAIVSDF